MYFKIILLVITLSLTTLPSVSYATDCNEAMQNVQNELDDLNDAIAGGNPKHIDQAQADYFAALGEAATCTNDWIGFD